MMLTDFLLARIAEDEERASRPNDDGPLDSWHTRDCGVHPQGLERTWCNCDVPARVLAECEAKRRIVEAFEDERRRRDIYNRGYDDGLLTTNDDLRGRLASNAHCRGLEIAMLALALPYADHPDFRDEWRQA